MTVSMPLSILFETWANVGVVGSRDLALMRFARFEVLDFNVQQEWCGSWFDNQCTSCERVVLGKGAKVLISESAQGTCPHIMEEEGEDQEDEKDDGREDGQQRVEGRIAESQNNRIMSA